MRRYKRIIIVGNGRLEPWILSEILPDDYIIGADAAVIWLMSHNIRVDEAVGDFDSTTSAELVEIKTHVPIVHQYSTHKDTTDLELAVASAINKKPKEVVIYGAIGSRLDHSLSAVHLLLQLLESNIGASIRDEKNETTLLDGRRTIIKDLKYTYISILPFTNTVTVTLAGLLYPADRLTIKKGQSIGVSNELIANKASVVVHSGVALIIRSRD